MTQMRTNRRLIWVPNALTVLRLALAVWFPWSSESLRGPIILTAGLSDVADGVIARRFGLTSWVGGLLDGLADKAFVLSVLITFGVEGRLAAWQVGLLVARDAAVLAIVLFLASLRRWDAFRRMPARRYGKSTTAAMFALLLTLALWPDAATVARALFALAAALSVMAAVDYLAHFVRSYTADRGARRD